MEQQSGEEADIHPMCVDGRPRAGTASESEIVPATRRAE